MLARYIIHSYNYNKDYYLPYHHILSTGKDDNSSSRKQKKGHSFQYILADNVNFCVLFTIPM